MKIKISAIFSIIITFLIIINLHILDFGDYSEFFRKFTAVISVCMGCICFFRKTIYKHIKEYCKWYNIWMIFFILYIFLKSLTAYYVGRSFLYTFLSYYLYTDILLFYPVIFVLTQQNSNKLMRTICFLTIFTLILKSIVWWFYNFKDLDIMHYLLYEFGAKWVRNGNQRIPAACFSGVLFSAAVYMFFLPKKFLYKLIGLILITFNFLYAELVFQSRAQIFSFLLSLFVVILLSYKYINIKRIKALSKLLSLLSLIIIIFIVVNNQDFQNLLHSLNDRSIAIRFEAYNYYLKLFAKNKWFGIASIYDITTIRGSHGNFYTSDLGLLGELFNYGIIGFTVVILPFVRFFYILIRNKRNNTIFYIFLVSLAVYSFVSSCLSNSIYSFRYFFAMPFIISFFEYFANIEQKK